MTAPKVNLYRDRPSCIGESFTNLPMEHPCMPLELAVLARFKGPEELCL